MSKCWDFFFYHSFYSFQAEIYKGVIQDVISQVKEAFLDENVDIDVLSQLKKVGTRVFFLRVVFQGEGVQCSAIVDRTNEYLVSLEVEEKWAQSI